MKSSLVFENRNTLKNHWILSGIITRYYRQESHQLARLLSIDLTLINHLQAA